MIKHDQYCSLIMLNHSTMNVNSQALKWVIMFQKWGKILLAFLALKILEKVIYVKIICKIGMSI